MVYVILNYIEIKSINNIIIVLYNVMLFKTCVIVLILNKCRSVRLIDYFLCNVYV